MIKVKLPTMLVCVISVFFTSVSIAHEAKPNSLEQSPMFIGIKSAPGQVVTQFHQALKAQYLAATNSELLEHNVKVTGNSAVSMSRSKTTGTYKNKTLNYEGMETIVLEKQLGEWKIVHIHWSN